MWNETHPTPQPIQAAAFNHGKSPIAINAAANMKAAASAPNGPTAAFWYSAAICSTWIRSSSVSKREEESDGEGMIGPALGG
jgi:hypothetical protein